MSLASLATVLVGRRSFWELKLCRVCRIFANVQLHRKVHPKQLQLSGVQNLARVRSARNVIDAAAAECDSADMVEGGYYFFAIYGLTGFSH